MRTPPVSPRPACAADTRHNGERPFIAVNMAMTADGKIATANREVSSFGSTADKRHLLKLRAKADAVMAGARTIDLNPVSLGPGPIRYRRMRLKNGLAEYNLRIVVSRTGSVNPDARIFNHTFSPIIVLTTKQITRERLERLRQFAEVQICGAKEIDFSRAFSWLRSRWGIRTLLCEGGGQLNDALFREGLVDELNLTVCPFIFGGRDAPTISDGLGSERLNDASRWRLKSMRRVGRELYLLYRAANRR